VNRWGDVDFVLVHLEIDDSGVVTELSRTQHGSELDDSVSNITLSDDGADFVVSGSTLGRTLNGEAIVPPKADSEGFVYVFSSSGELDYQRFIGTVDANEALSSYYDSVGVKSVISEDGGIFVRSLDLDGEDDADFTDLQIRLPADYDFASFDKYKGSQYSIVVSSKFGGATPELTPSQSKDVFFYDVSVSGSRIQVPETIATSHDDIAVASANLVDRSTIAIVGDTYGEFEEGGAIGDVGERDAFFGVVNYASSPSLAGVTQFGTPGDDYVIDVISANDEKFLVLWKENHTSGDGSFRYRITPFAPDGTNLLPLTSF